MALKPDRCQYQIFNAEYIDTGTYETGMVVHDKEMASLNIERPEGQNQQWNYTIRPRVKTSEPKIAC